MKHVLVAAGAFTLAFLIVRLLDENSGNGSDGAFADIASSENLQDLAGSAAEAGAKIREAAKSDRVFKG